MKITKRKSALNAIKRDVNEARNIDKTLMEDRKFMLDAVMINGNILKYASDFMRADREIVLRSVQNSRSKGESLQYADQKLKSDEYIVLQGIKNNSSFWKKVLNYADESLKRNTDFMLTVIKKYGAALNYADETLRKDKNFILKSVKRNGGALAYVDEEFKKDKEIVLEAVKNDGRALAYADEEFKKDKEIVLEAVKNNEGTALEYADETLKIDNEIVLEALKNGSYALKYADEILEISKEVILRIVQCDEKALMYASEKIKGNKDVVLEAVKKYGKALKYASETLKDDKEIVIEAVKSDFTALDYVGEKIRKDKEVGLEHIRSKSKYIDEKRKAEWEQWHDPYYDAEWDRAEEHIIDALDESLQKDPDIIKAKRNPDIIPKILEKVKREQNIIKGYQGIFLDEETQAKLVKLQKDGLENIVKDMHITLNFGELQKYPQELMEKDIPIKLVGYASDGKNSGFQVELTDEIKPYNKNNNLTSFITVSLGKVNGVKGKPVDTGKLDFKELEEPIQIEGKLGYFKFEQDKSKSKVIMNNSIFETTRTAKENELKEKMQESDELDATLEKVEQLEKMQADKNVESNLDENDGGDQK